MFTMNFFTKTLCKTSFVNSSSATENLLKCRHLCFTVKRWAIDRGQAVGAHQSSSTETEYVNAEEKRPYIQASWDTSIRYMESSAYDTTYGDDVVWKNYRRNFKGQHAPETRVNCVRQGMLNTGSPCPICRDELLTVDYRNLKLLKQFLNPLTGELLTSRKTGICQKQLRELQLALEKAVDHGFIHMKLEHRHYDYDLYQELANKSRIKSGADRSDNYKSVSQVDGSATNQAIIGQTPKDQLFSSSCQDISNDSSEQSLQSTEEMGASSSSSDESSSSSDGEYSSSDEEMESAVNNKPEEQNDPLKKE